jgi:hypothetical protein
MRLQPLALRELSAVKMLLTSSPTPAEVCLHRSLSGGACAKAQCDANDAARRSVRVCLLGSACGGEIALARRRRITWRRRRITWRRRALPWRRAVARRRWALAQQQFSWRRGRISTFKRRWRDFWPKPALQHAFDVALDGRRRIRKRPVGWWRRARLRRIVGKWSAAAGVRRIEV